MVNALTFCFAGGDNASAVRRKISAEGGTEGIHFNWDTVGSHGESHLT